MNDQSDSPAPRSAHAPAELAGFFGARFSLYPMTDRFIPVILSAIEGLREGGLTVESDDVSTFVGGPRGQVFGVLRRAMARAAASGAHVVMTVLFSYG